MIKVLSVAAPLVTAVVFAGSALATGSGGVSEPLRSTWTRTSIAPSARRPT